MNGAHYEATESTTAHDNPSDRWVKPSRITFATPTSIKKSSPTAWSVLNAAPSIRTLAGNGRREPQMGHIKICPACRRISEKFPAGIVTLCGPFPQSQRDDLIGLVRQQEETEKTEHPLNRIISVDDSLQQVVITNTHIHLPQRIGEAVKRAFHGSVEIDFDKDEYLYGGLEVCDAKSRMSCAGSTSGAHRVRLSCRVDQPELQVINKEISDGRGTG
jgi:hypothetical protein